MEMVQLQLPILLSIMSSRRMLYAVSANPIVFMSIAVLLNISCLAAVTTTNTIFSGNETDRLALLALSSKILHDPQGVMNSWNDSINFCQWQGVTCGSRHSRVIHLNLASRGLVGSLSPHIGNLSFLRSIRLENNTLEGKIPPELGRLFRLQSLYLVDNSFEGRIPGNLSHCYELTRLRLGHNKLFGEIPRELGSTTLSKLTILSIHENNLSGKIPSTIGNLTSLRTLSASFNSLEGSVPESLGGLQNLTQLGIGENKLTGTIPLSLYNLSLLMVFSVGVNHLYGSLPQDFGLTLPNLQIVELQGNEFSGLILPSLSNVSNLEQVDISDNNFVGKVPVNFGRFEYLRLLYLGWNSLGDGKGDDMKFLDPLANCSMLEKLGLNFNQLGGILPNSIGNFSTKLRYFGVAVNWLSGTIPSGFGNLINLERLQMGYNQLEGEIPDDIGKIEKLQQLYLSDNQLSEKIPFSLGNLSFLSQLGLENNRFHGTIPPSIGKCKNLIMLNLSNNNLSGTIPSELCSASALSISLNLAQNNLNGPLPSEVGNLIHLAKLDVSENELTGEIPSSLGKCSDLLELYMEGNFFRGSIPPSLSSLRGIQNFDISRNNLSGQIPTFLEKFSLEKLNLSFNDFEGEVPRNRGVFTNSSAISVVGNSRLCGGIPELELPKCENMKKNSNLSHLHIVLISAGTALLGIVLVASFLFYWLKKKRKVNASGSISKEPFLKVSYEMLLKATDRFSSTNLIGAGSFGSVYKAILEGDEKIVAVKVLNLQRRGATKSFMAECEALRNIRHRNLVKTITSCSSIDFQGSDFKALIYEFMPNGSLERWLHPRTMGSDGGVEETDHILPLHRRIDIALDVACAVDYLHHHCGKPIIHCDIKPSNVLLDEDMVAHVGDFGLSRIFSQPPNQPQSSSIGVRGTIGYVAPEYGLGSEVSTNGDVYSYGILLLEMMTGKRPTNPMFQEGLDLHKFASMALPDQVLAILDPVLLLNNDDDDDDDDAENNNTATSPKEGTSGNRKENCLISILKIGVACSVESPQERMDISSVVHELHSVKNILN